jgi:hypothetical protein
MLGSAAWRQVIFETEYTETACVEWAFVAAVVAGLKVSRSPKSPVACSVERRSSIPRPERPTLPRVYNKNGPREL